MDYLLDTNILSELRKGYKATLSVKSWFDAIPAERMFVSVMAVGEIRRGIALTRRSDLPAAIHLERWLDQLVESAGPRMLPVTLEIADLWGGLCPTQRLPAVDGLMAATAIVHDLTIATRNTRDFERSGARMINPFSAP